MRRVLLASVTVAGVLTSMAAAVPQFSAAPTAVSNGDGARISFAVASPCDVQVEILNAAGKIVRHLGGGVLGDNPPLPFVKGLRQDITWDGKDDVGKPAAGGPFKARVGLGLKPVFDRVIGWNGNEVEDVRGLTCGPDGTLYLVYGGQLYAHRRTTLISAFDRQGKYLRQVLPGPGGLPADKRGNWPHVMPAGAGDAREVPIVWHILGRSVMPGAIFDDRIFPSVTSDGRLVLLSGSGKSFAKVDDPDFREGRRLLVIGTDGILPKNYLGPVVAGKEDKGHGWTAVAPDGKTAYACGVGAGNTVWRADLSGSAPAVPFITAGLNDPRGLAVDRDGNLYIADCGNNRIAVYGQTGNFITEFPAKSPWQVQVSRKTGAIYAVIEDGATLVKLGGLKDPAVKASLPTQVKPGEKITSSVMIALDDSAEPHAVWLLSRNWHNGKLNRLVDKGAGFDDQGDVIAAHVRKDSAVNFTGDAAVVGDTLVTRHMDFGYNWKAQPLVFNTLSGEPAGPFKARTQGEIYSGKDGRFYEAGKGFKKPFPVSRFSEDGSEDPFPAGDSINEVWHGHTRTWGLFVTRHGDIYVPGGDAYRALNPGTVRVYGPDGQRKGDPVINTSHAYLGGIAVDSRGNIYLGAQVAPKGKPAPEWFEGRLPADTPEGYPSLCYREYGTVIKFPPEGGAIADDPQGAFLGCYTENKSGPVALKEALWNRRGGLIPIRGKGAPCFCETSRFDIDAHDRLFIPDIHRFCVQVLDAAGNPIALIGSYGNMDNRGPGSPHPQPAIAYGWPLTTEVADGKLYVADLTNRRIVVARLENAVSESCAIR